MFTDLVTGLLVWSDYDARRRLDVAAAADGAAGEASQGREPAPGGACHACRAVSQGTFLEPGRPHGASTCAATTRLSLLDPFRFPDTSTAHKS